MAERTLADFSDTSQQSSSSAKEVAPGQGSSSAAAFTLEEQQRPMEDDSEPIRPLRKPKTVRDVEREGHEAAGHTPYRDWCVHCVTGTGRGDQHQQRAESSSENLKPVIAADYVYLNDRSDSGEEAGSPPILVTRLSDGWTSSQMVPAKGIDPYAIVVLEGEMVGLDSSAVVCLGSSAVLFRSDQERALVAMKDEAAARVKQKGINVFEAVRYSFINIG